MTFVCHRAAVLQRQATSRNWFLDLAAGSGWHLFVREFPQVQPNFPGPGYFPQPGLRQHKLSNLFYLTLGLDPEIPLFKLFCFIIVVENLFPANIFPKVK